MTNVLTIVTVIKIRIMGNDDHGNDDHTNDGEDDPGDNEEDSDGDGSASVPQAPSCDPTMIMRHYQVVILSQYFPMLPSGLRPSGNIGKYWLRLTT